MQSTRPTLLHSATVTTILLTACCMGSMTHHPGQHYRCHHLQEHFCLQESQLHRQLLPPGPRPGPQADPQPQPESQQQQNLAPIPEAAFPAAPAFSAFLLVSCPALLPFLGVFPAAVHSGFVPTIHVTPKHDQVTTSNNTQMNTNESHGRQAG